VTVTGGTRYDQLAATPTDSARAELWQRLNMRYAGSTHAMEVLFEESDLEWLDDGWTLDGMDAAEWCDAMTQE